MTIILDGTKGTTTPGLYSNTTFTGTYADGIVVDYTSTLGRISVGTTDGIAFYNGGVATTELMRIDSSGNVGIGTSSPSTLGKLVVAGGEAAVQGASSSGAAITLYNNAATSSGFRIGQGYVTGSDNVAFVSNQANAAMVFRTNATEQMRIDSSGNVGIGTSSPSYKLDAYGVIRSYDSGSSTSGFLFAGTNIVNIEASGTNPISFRNNSTERMRIDSSGNLLVGTADSGLTTGNGFKVLPNLSGAGVPAVLIDTAGSTSGNSSLLIYSTGASAYRFYVRNDGAIFATNTTVQGISDQRLKENIKDIDYGLEKILALQPRRFDWKDGKGLNKKNDIGFIAQEFETVIPEFVDQSIDCAEDGTSLKTVGAAGLIPVLVKAIQEQQAIIEQLRADVEQLKGQA